MLAIMLTSALPAAADDPDLGTFSLSREQLDLLPGGSFLPAFFESYAPGTVLLNEESNGFSLLEAPRVYAAGESPDLFRWLVGGFAVDSVLEPGSPAVRIPSLAASALCLSEGTPLHPDTGLGWELGPTGPAGHRLLLSTAIPRLGGVWRGGRHLVPNLAAERGDVVATGRRRLGENGNFAWRWDTRDRRGASWRVAADFTAQERRFNDPASPARQVTEKGTLGSLFLYRRPAPASKAPELLVTAEWLGRDRLGAEWGRLPTETMTQDRQALVVGLGREGTGGGWRGLVQVERDSRTPQSLTLTKELVDSDGEGIWPFERWGTRTALTLWGRGTLRRKVGALALEPYAEVKLTPTWGSEGTYGDSALLLEGAPWRAVRWQAGEDWRRIGLDGRLGTSLTCSLGGGWRADGSLLLRAQALGGGDLAATPTFWMAGFDAGLRYDGGPTRLLAALGVQPESLPLSAADFLVLAAPAATLYDWSDSDGDRSFDAGEEGQVRGISGGRYHSLAAGTVLPRRERVLLEWRQRLSSVWRLGLQGLLRRERNGLWVTADREEGVTQSVDGVPVFFSTGAPGQFILGNRAFGRDPFYGQFLLDLTADRPGRWMFHFSFMAHLGMAETPLGNGPTADARSIGEAMADPNVRTFAFGRVDGDRAFVLRVYGIRHLSSRVSLSASLKYRDGTPFAFLAVARSAEGAALYPLTIKGEDEHGKKGGPREDCIWDLGLAVHWRFTMAGRSCRLSLQGFNLLDPGSELAEDAFAGNLRRALELELPRSLRLSLEVDLSPKR